MERCACSTWVRRWSAVAACDACPDSSVHELPRRSGYAPSDFVLQRQHGQSASSQSIVRVKQRRICLLDTLIDPLTRAEAIAEIERFVAAGQPRQLVTVNVDFVRIAQENERFRRVVNNSDLAVADGKPLLWAARWTGQELPARITGMDLVLDSASLAAKRDESMFLLGAAEGIAAKAATALKASFPGLEVHWYSPPMGPFSDLENMKMVQLIRESGAKYLFVALGAPRQDVWINDHLAELGVPVCAGIGGVLDYLAGSVKRAPTWVQDLGMEWLYRVYQEPARLWRRYFLLDLPVFARMLLVPLEASAGLGHAYRPAQAATQAAVAEDTAAYAGRDMERNA